jgi:hypothetical protein
MQVLVLIDKQLKKVEKKEIFQKLFVPIFRFFDAEDWHYLF